MSDDWTPDQPLRADATDEQLKARILWRFENDNTVDDDPVAIGVLTAREFAAALRAAPRSSGTVTREQAEALPTWTPEQIAHFQQEAGGAAFFILRDTVLALFSGVPSAAEGSRKETPR